MMVLLDFDVVAVDIVVAKLLMHPLRMVAAMKQHEATVIRRHQRSLLPANLLTQTKDGDRQQPLPIDVDVLNFLP